MKTAIAILTLLASQAIAQLGVVDYYSNYPTGYTGQKMITIGKVRISYGSGLSDGQYTVKKGGYDVAYRYVYQGAVYTQPNGGGTLSAYVDVAYDGNDLDVGYYGNVTLPLIQYTDGNGLQNVPAISASKTYVNDTNGVGGTTDLGVLTTINVGNTALPTKMRHAMNYVSDGNKAHVLQGSYVNNSGTTIFATINLALGARVPEPGQTLLYLFDNPQSTDQIFWKIDGKTIFATQGLPVVNPNTGQTFDGPPASFEFTDIPVAVATGTSSPVANQTNNGDTTVTTREVTATGTAGVVTGSSGSVTRTTAVNNGNTTIAGGTGGATTQDFYGAVRAALMDAGNTGSLPEFDTSDKQANKKTELESQEHWDELQGKVTSAATKRTTVINGLTEKFDGIKSKVNSLDDNPGKITEIDFGEINILGTTKDLSISLTSGPTATIVNVIRLVLLWGATIGFIYVSIQSTRSYV